VKDLYNENYETLKKETEEDTRRWKKPPTFMDWQNSYCENGYTTESNLQIQCNPHQNANVILHRNIKINSKVHMEA
jgi:hypothetical protein